MDEETAKKVLKKIKLISIISSLGFTPIIFIVILIAILVVLGIITTGDASESVTSGPRECGFIISKTSLTKSEYKTKIEEFAASRPNFAIFAENANAIYEYATSKNVNPELVVIRAYVEDSDGEVTGANNYWGLGCTNESQGAGCYSWSSFEEGYIYFIDVVSKYESLSEMMLKYSYIGDYWYTLDTDNPSGDGGCYYAEHIYPDNMPDRVKNACAQGAPSCVINGNTANCTPTTDEDQEAYMKWQVKTNMGTVRKTIFGLEFDEGPCSSSGSSSLSSLSSYTLKHEGLNLLNRKLTESEVTELNNYINNEVDKSGYGTGAGVAAAGQALTYGLEQKGYYLEYRWGGGHDGNNYTGVNPNWGSTSFGCDSNNRCNYGLDCSGFVSWAIRTACNPQFGTMTTSTMVGTSFGKSVSISEAQPGDLMLKNGHVRLVIKNNNDGTVIVAEEAGSPTNGLIFNKFGATNAYKFVSMSNYYNSFCKSTR